MANAGIDYGMGTTNRDPETGIRFGVISQGTVGQAWYDCAQADYGKPTCPKCGNDAIDYDAEKDAKAKVNPTDDDEDFDCAEYESKDFICESCEYVFGCESAYGEEPTGWTYEGDGYSLTDCLESDIMVLTSSFYTFAQFCSPCVPGAGNLDSPIEDGAKTFCLGHDWFEDGKAPYRVFRVSDDSEVLPS